MSTEGGKNQKVKPVENHQKRPRSCALISRGGFMSECSGAEDKRTTRLTLSTNEAQPFLPSLDVCQFAASDRQNGTGSWSAHFSHCLLLRTRSWTKVRLAWRSIGLESISRRIELGYSPKRSGQCTCRSIWKRKEISSDVSFSLTADSQTYAAPNWLTAVDCGGVVAPRIVVLDRGGH